jgi:hypothetical protein
MAARGDTSRGSDRQSTYKPQVYRISTLKKFGSTSLPPEVQQQAATTPENFGSKSAYKIRSPSSGHLSLESTRQMQNVLTFEQFLTIHFAY